MRTILRDRALQLVFAANLVSMMGSGMNSAGVTWHILQTTHSETALGTLVVLATLPAVVVMPLSGVLIDRHDRRRLVMLLDSLRALVVLTVAILALTGKAQVWQIYCMVMLVAAGFWMFWPTITALVQELTPGAEFVESNNFLLAGVQAGWMLAGALVGYTYNHIGLGGVLLIDCGTYLVSLSCYLFVRKGQHLVKPPHESAAQAMRRVEGAVSSFFYELGDGFRYLRAHKYILPLGLSYSLFLSAMWMQSILTAPLADRLLHGGAIGYGRLNGSWAIGALLSTAYSPWLIRRIGGYRTVALGMGLLALCLFGLPFSGQLLIASGIYVLMGSSRGVGGVAISSGMMEFVPKHFMGRVQNTFFFLATIVQLTFGFLVGATAHRVSLTLAFAIVGTTYLAAALSTLLPLRPSPSLAEPAAAQD
jgi:DHA3 family macrolide efflux protein-like MFS transporter